MVTGGRVSTSGLRFTAAQKWTRWAGTPTEDSRPRPPAVRAGCGGWGLMTSACLHLFMSKVFRHKRLRKLTLHRSLSSATREAQEYWSGQPMPSPVDLPNPGVEPGSPALQADSLPIELSWKPFVSKEPINSWDDLITLWNNRGKKNNSLIV